MSGISAGQFGVIATVHLLGLLSAALARIMEGRPWQATCERVFIGLLVVVAFTTLLTLWHAPLQWMMSATTLSVMVLTATCDFSRSS